MTENTEDTDYIQQMLAESANQVFSELCTKEVVDDAENGIWPEQLWNNLNELGFFNAVLPESAGGSDMALVDVLSTVRIAGQFAAPIPFGETIIAGWLFAQAGLAVPEGPLAFGPADRRQSITLTQTGDGWQLQGVLRNIPWGSSVSAIALLLETDQGLMLACIDPKTATQTDTTNLAGEPRTRLEFDHVAVPADGVKPAPANVNSQTAYLMGALLRSLQMAGALITARDLAVRYTGERIAFGKPLNRLQAVQQNLAVLAGQTAAANVAADMALDALANPTSDLESSVALARVRINDAAEIAARLAHQAHGAIGFTYEHMLHHATRRLWSWRDEFGNDAYWAEQVGQQVLNAGSDNLWTFVTRAAQL